MGGRKRMRHRGIIKYERLGDNGGQKRGIEGRGIER